METIKTEITGKPPKWFNKFLIERKFRTRIGSFTSEPKFFICQEYHKEPVLALLFLTLRFMIFLSPHLELSSTYSQTTLQTPYRITTSRKQKISCKTTKNKFRTVL